MRQSVPGGIQEIAAAVDGGHPPGFMESMFHLHKVRDDLREVRELLGLLHGDGLLAVMVPAPFAIPRTKTVSGGDTAWSYGMDALGRFREGVHPFHAMQTLGRDPVTGVENLVYVFAKSPDSLQDAALALGSPLFSDITEEGIVPSELPQTEPLKEPVNVPCVLCGSRVSDLFGQRGYRHYHYPGPFQVRRCAGCGLLFNSPRLNMGDYQDLYRNDYYFFDRPDHTEFARVAEICRRTVSMFPWEGMERTLLEIGAAKGYLLALLKRMGWTVSGVEISPTAAEYARKTLGVDMFSGTIEEYVRRHAGASFQVVLASDLIEHIPDLDAFFRSVRKVLKSGGLLVLDTPNAASQSVRMQGMDARCFNPFHIFLFSPATLAMLLERNGFAVEKLFTYGNGAAGGGRVPQPPPGASLGEVMDLCVGSLAKTAYADLPDAAGPLAKSLEGLNLVAVARLIGTKA